MTIHANGREYRARQTVVGICLDGTSQAYLDAAAGVMPHLQRSAAAGAHGLVKSAIPSFTNPNNIAIVTGAPPAVNGICGNFYFDEAAQAEVMMDDPAYLRCPTILSAFANAGKAVGVVTAKDKLRRLLGKDLRGTCFSVEAMAREAERDPAIARIMQRIDRPPPTIYDPEISVYCLEAGWQLIQDQSLDLAYLTTTDFVQHKYEPGSAEANRFLARLDEFIGKIDSLGVVLGVTADHGMNAKTKPDGSPKVEFIEQRLKDSGIDEARVILPITDPYVVHHGALGSYATVYLREESIAKAREILSGLEGIELILSRDEAAERFALPPDRIGQLVVLSDRDTVLGRMPEWHDLSVVKEGLRSHGGLHEQVVPMIVNRRLKSEHAHRLRSGAMRNFDLFDILCNGVEDQQ
jgi:phosphonoacetate hydrolase